MFKLLAHKKGFSGISPKLDAHHLQDGGYLWRQMERSFDCNNLFFYFFKGEAKLQNGNTIKLDDRPISAHCINA